MDKLRMVARLPFRLVMYIVYGLDKLGRAVCRGLRPVLGRMAWQAPAWLRAIARQIKRWWQICVNHQARTSLAMLLVLCLVAGALWLAHWYHTRPVPALVKFSVSSPSLTNYQGQEPRPQNLSINFHASVAPLELSGKAVPPGLIDIQPVQAGTWQYSGDRRLIFTPSQDWPAGREYKIRWQADKLFAPHVLVDKALASFSSVAFTPSISQSGFEQDQQDPNIRKGVFRLSFSHPVDLPSLQKRISLSQKVTGSQPRNINFTLNADDKLLNVYIVSDNIELQEQGSQIALKIDSGVMPLVGGAPFARELTAQLSVPSIYGLAVDNAQTMLADNEDYSVDQLIGLQFNQRIADREVKQAVRAYVLPTYKTEQEEKSKRAHNWHMGEIDDQVVALSSTLELAHLESQEQYASGHNFKYQAKPGDYILLQVNRGLEAFGGYLLGKDYFTVLKVPDYVPSLSLAGKGSLLALSGEQRVTIVGRNLDNAYVELARLQPEQLHHLVALNNGSLAQPSLYLSPDNISDRFETSIAFINQPQPQYKGVDLAPWLRDKNRLGVFLLRLTDNKDALRHDTRDYRNNGRGNYDARLIVVSDLGLLMKQEQAGGTHVYVQSIHSGRPVSGALVQLMAMNGKVLQQVVSDAQGHAFFSKIDNYVRELKPIMFMVQKDADSNFLPLGGQQVNFLNYSRFDVGGESTPQDSGQLRAHMLSDCGLYRPGDTINLAAIVRDYGWNKQLAGLPVVITLTDSRGRNVLREQIKLNADGFVEASYSSQLTSPTGTWSAGIYPLEANNATTLLGSTRIRVEEFQPDTMKVKARLNKYKEQGWVSPQDIEGLVTVENLFGTPAQNRRIEASFSLQPAFPRFNRYPDYTFHDPSKNPRSWQEQLTPAVSDAKGQALFKLNLSQFSEASFQLTFMAKAYEAQGGREVSAMVSTLVSPNAYLVGSKADGGLSFINRQAIRKISFIAVDSDLQPVLADKLKLTLIEHKYVSVLTRQGSGLYKYESREKHDNLWEEEFSIAAGGLDYNLPTGQPGRFSLVVSNNDGQVLNKIDFSVAGAGNISRSLERNAELELLLNKASYAPGEEIKLSIRAPYSGSGLITIERDKVYSHVWFKADTSSSVQSITLPEGIEGNAYVNVQFIRDPGSDEVFMSPLSYAVAPFNINREQRTLAFTMQAPEMIKPGQELNIKLSSPHQGTFLVFAVDEGILQVARYNLADPLATFFSKQALAVRTAQLLDMILPEFQKLMTMSAPGGGMAEIMASRMIAENLNPFQRIREAPVVYWSGLVEVDGEKTLTWQVPDYFNGSLRIMAVAVNRDMLGTAQRNCLVRGDFVLTPSLPATVAPGDEFVVSLGVANNLPGEKSIPVDVTLETSEGLLVMGDTKQTLDLKPMHEGYVLFKLKAADIPGAATLKAGASWQDKNGARSLGLSVRPATPFVTTIRSGMMQDREQAIEGLRSMYEPFANRSIWAGFTPLVLMQGLNGFLSFYPHQCSEQLTSQAYAGLIISRHPALAELLDNKISQARISKTIATLQNRQNSSGVVGAYTAAVNEEPFVTPYVVQFLLEAKSQDIEVPAGMLSQANAYLHSLAGNKAYSQLDQLRMRCFAIYLLTRQGVVSTSYIAQVRETLDRYYQDVWHNDLCAAYLASAFKLMKQEKEAERLFAKLFKQVNTQNATENWQGLYDGLAQNAIAVYLATLHFPELELSSIAIDNLARPLAAGNFNTISAAMALLALDGYAKTVAPRMEGGMTLTQINQADNDKLLAETQAGLLVSAFDGNAKTLLLNNHTQLPAWFSLLQAGYENKLPLKANSNGLEILREYYDQQGKPLIQAQLGQEVVVRLKIRSTQQSHIDNLVVIELLPGGFEIVRNTSGPKGNWQPYYADNREDRIVLYGAVGQDVSEYVYIMKATSRGQFIVPPAYAESMYVSGINANSAPGVSLQVVEPVE